ncbi:hypothetical protein CA265_07340 [Sphingobacteriaceae bacterium GW460-11-11-14-LB5]|nr:hypothetical protein CA265_07340 [Sphingobacteriaceae bacterium GW460-11-11-14-LB5]
MKDTSEIIELIKDYEKRELDLRLDNEQLRRLNDALRLAEEKSAILTSIISSSDDAIVSKDLNGIVTSWNNAAARIFGYTAEEMIGSSILKVIPIDRHEEEPKILSQLRKGDRVDHFETIRRKKDGTLIHVSLTISPIKDSSGQVIGLSKIARDITEKKLVEKKKDEFISFVSHELKTPLTSLRSYIQIALHKLKLNGNDFIAHALTKAEQQTKKMENMITDFLHISRLEGGQLKFESARFDLVATIRSCIEDAEASSEKHQLVYEGENEAMVMGDAEKISLVMTNLLSNAQKYSPDGGIITVSCKRSDQNLIISVKDQGIGISSEDKKNMFQKFYRIRSEKTRNISGFGIGLYLSSSIISLHGSSISVESKLDEGSTFSFSLKTAD